ncbi:MAG: four-helix bundle copper-binding protein [Gammaproteobacteria bacterium]|nr:four-helix bundle copper-binding protein [Gammaproteobacteria bacterium]
MDCAQICRLASGYMARDSELARVICEVCAQVCEMCGEECPKYSMEHCQQCAAACRRCAEECRRMVAATPKPRAGQSAQIPAH